LIVAWDITNQPYLDFSRYNSNRLKDTHQLDIRIDKEFYFKKWALNIYADVQNAYVFKTQGVPIYTNKDKETGEPVIDPSDNTSYVLREVDDNFSGVLLPTIGLIVKI
ncbi:MAG: TonB-dependent receptor, partial [Paludibacteraceae bacterium]|nr:TonB-dependent receptor [Paludibacteraceae bacterium]